MTSHTSLGQPPRRSDRRTPHALVDGSEMPSVRADLRAVDPYSSPRADVSVLLNANESPHSPSPRLLTDLMQEIGCAVVGLHRYPDPEAAQLRHALARYLSDTIDTELDSAHIWVANGSNEILQQLLLAFGGPGRIALGVRPCYQFYAIAAASTCTSWLSAPHRPDHTLDTAALCAAIARERPQLVLLSSPHNPTGASIPLDGLIGIFEAAPGLVIIDEAYAEFSEEPSAVALLPSYGQKLVVTRTLSKAFGLAGARLGYAVATPAIVRALRTVTPPYHLSALAQAVGRIALRHTDITCHAVALIRAERARIATALDSLGYRVLPSDANFLLFGEFTGANGAHQAWRSFLSQGVLVRDPGVPGYLRVTIGTPVENCAFLHAATELASQF